MQNKRLATINHQTTVHARCPYLPVWDYYTVTFSTSSFLKVETLEKACETVRGKKITQEQLAKKLAKKMPAGVKVTVVGMHGANCRSEVSW